MASRAELELRAAAVNVNPASYANDSNFEQAIIYAEKAVTTTSSATQTTPSAASVAKISGGQNV